MNERPRKVQVTRDYLEKFPDPLWDKIDLEDCKALSAIEGVHDGYRFVIVDIEHRRLHLLGSNGKRASTTFVVVGIPDAVVGRRVTWHLPGHQASVDAAYAYITRPQKQARPHEWRELIEATIKMVESLKGDAKAKGTTPAAPPTYRPVGAGAGVHTFWAVVGLGLALVFTAIGVATLFGWLDYRPDCRRGADTVQCSTTITTWRAWEAFKQGGQSLLVAGVCLAIAAYHRERVRKRLSVKS